MADSTVQKSVQKAKLGDIRRLITSMILTHKEELHARVAREAMNGVRVAQPTVFKSMVYGSPGIGKSMMYAQIARETGMKLAVISMATQDLVSLQGVPVPDRKKRVMEFFATQQLPRGIPASLGGAAWDGEYGILLLDEMTSAPSRNVQTMIMRLVLEGVMEDYILPPGWVICMAGNLGEDDGTESEDLVTALLDRIDLKFHTLPDAKSWLEYGAGYEVNGNPVIHPVIAAYIAEDNSRLSTIEEQMQQYDGQPIGFVTPRSWKALSDNIYKYQESKGVKDLNKITLSDEMRLLIKGEIGPDAGNGLIDFIGIVNKIPFTTAEMLDKNPKANPVTLEKKAKLYIYLSAAQKIRNDLKDAEFYTKGSGKVKFLNRSQTLFGYLAQETEKEVVMAAIGHYSDAVKVEFKDYLKEALVGVTSTYTSHPTLRGHLVDLARQLAS